MVEHDLANNATQLALTLLNGASAVLGAYFSLVALRAYRKHHAKAMLALSIGVALLTIAILAEGFVFVVLGWPLARAHTTEALVTLLAMGVIVTSLHWK